MMKSLLLTILDVSSGTGVGNWVGSAVFAYLTDKVGIEFCRACFMLSLTIGPMHAQRWLASSSFRPTIFRCADHSVQRGVMTSERYKREASALTCEHPPKQSFATVLPIGSSAFGIQQKEPPHQDSPTRWNSTHQMCSNALQKQEALDLAMRMLHKDAWSRNWSIIGSGVV
jgi:hypothetical protein